MINVVLVEDEKLVLLGMKMCIQESGENMKVAAAFSSAEDALDYFEANTADVLITDIRLTGMSGLDLIKRIKPDHRHMLIIVLSCYEDFSYARTAYELGVDKYILKHELVEDELAAMISDMYAVRMARQTAREAGINDLGMELKRKSLIRPECKYFIGYITLRGETGDPASDAADISYPMVVEIIQEILHRDDMGECFLRHNDELFCIFCFDAASTREQIASRLEGFLDNMSKNIKNYFNRYSYLTLSESFNNLREVKTNFDEAKKFSGYTFYMDRPGILWVEQTKPHNGECPEVPFNPQNIFTNRWMGEFETGIQEFFKSQRESFVSADKLKVQVVKFVNEFSSFLARYYDLDINQAFQEETRPDYFSINGFTNADGLRDWLIRMVRKVKEYVFLHEKKETTIARIVEYAEQNYRSSITLTDIAEKFHMNTVYVCQLFKKKTGVTFIHFINRLRIEKAKGLLLSTDLTAEQIAERVGIMNNNYFFRLFKKATGQTVKQYRKNLK